MCQPVSRTALVFLRSTLSALAPLPWAGPLLSPHRGQGMLDTMLLSVRSRAHDHRVHLCSRAFFNLRTRAHTIAHTNSLSLSCPHAASRRTHALTHSPTHPFTDTHRMPRAGEGHLRILLQLQLHSATQRSSQVRLPIPHAHQITELICEGWTQRDRPRMHVCSVTCVLGRVCLQPAEKRGQVQRISI